MQLVERNVYKGIAPYLEAREAVVVTGMRRVGKTSLLRLVYDRIESKNKLFLDLENPINQKYLDNENYEIVKKNLAFLGLDFSQRAYLFLDEIQIFKKLPSVVKYLIDTYNVKFFLTGSVSFYLKNFFSETLVGRKFLFEIHPLTFGEFMKFKEARVNIPNDPQHVTEQIYQSIEPLFDEYLTFGGFPEVVLQSSVEAKKKHLEEIFTSYFQFEVVRLGDFRKNKTIQELILLLMQRVGTKLDISKLASELGISRITLAEYLSFLEGTYFISLIKPYNTDNSEGEIKKAPKLYICDTGIVNHLVKLDDERLFKNFVYNELKHLGKVGYYERKSGVELDFILDNKIIIDSRVSVSDQDASKVERLSSELNIPNHFIASRKFKEQPSKRNVIYGFGLEKLNS